MKNHAQQVAMSNIWRAVVITEISRLIFAFRLSFKIEVNTLRVNKET